MMYGLWQQPSTDDYDDDDDDDDDGLHSAIFSSWSVYVNGRPLYLYTAKWSHSGFGSEYFSFSFCVTFDEYFLNLLYNLTLS